MSSMRQFLMDAIAEYELSKEDEDVQALLYEEEAVGKPSIFTHPLADILRAHKVPELLKTVTKVEKVVNEEEKPPEQVEKVTKGRKTAKKSAKPQRNMSVRGTMRNRSAYKKISGSPKASKTVVKREGSGESKRTNQTGRSSVTLKTLNRKTRPKTPSETSISSSVDIIHIVTVNINQQLQKELKCEVGVDLFMEMPWKIIPRSTLMKTVRRDQTKSPFYDYAPIFQVYPEEEILVGRASLYDCDAFIVGLTIHGRNLLLEDIKRSHMEKWERLLKMSNCKARPWQSLGSEVEIDKEVLRNTRPFISFDCYIQKKYHEKVFSEGFDYIESYSELRETGLVMVENIRGTSFDKHTQACPTYQDASAQTIPEIPVNSTTQFTIEMRVAENEEKLKTMEINYESLNNKLTAFYYKIDSLLTYNEEFDLYKDDYEVLASEGEVINIFPNIVYEHYSTMMTFVGTKGKGITCTSWHPSQVGLIAVAYGKHHVARVGDLLLDSDDELVNESDEDTDDEKFFNSYEISNRFDEHIENIWKEQLEDLENDIRKIEDVENEITYDTEEYDLAIASNNFIEQTKNIRLFQIIQDKKRFLKAPDVEDLYHVESFEYPLYEKMKVEKKKETEQGTIDGIIDTVFKKEPTFLKRDYLFSGNFHWKLKMADEVFNPIDLLIMKKNGCVPKKYVRTFLFREIWGDNWNCGDDLKYMAIELNKDFRESAIFAFGKPTVPGSNIFLPGIRKQNKVDYTVELNPWQWIDAWLQHCVFRAENNIALPTTEQLCDLPEPNDDDDEPFNFLFLRNTPIYDVQYEDVNLQFYLCDNKHCKHCQYILNNVNSIEGRDHVCLKIIMNKNKPEKLILMPYEKVHDSFDKKEEILFLKKKQKEDIKKDDTGETLKDNLKDAQKDNKEVTVKDNKKDTQKDNKEVTVKDNKEVTVKNNKENTQKDNKEVTVKDNKEDTQKDSKVDTQKDNKEVTAKDNKEDTQKDNKDDTQKDNKEVTQKDNKDDIQKNNKKETQKDNKEDSKKDNKEDSKKDNKESTQKEDIQKEKKEIFFEDEYELPFCSIENGCLIRKLLPDYLKDSRTKKLFCDQCGDIEPVEKIKSLEDFELYPIASEEKKNVLDVETIEKIIEEPDTSESEGSEDVSEEQLIDDDMVGKFLHIGDVSHPNLENKLSGKIIGNSGPEPTIDQCDEDKRTDDSFSISSSSETKSLDRYGIDVNYEEGTIKSSNDEPTNEEKAVIPINYLFKDEDRALEYNPDELDDGDKLFQTDVFVPESKDSDEITSTSSSVTFKSAAKHKEDKIETENVDRKGRPHQDFTNKDKDPDVGIHSPPSIGVNKTKLIQEYEEPEEIILDIKHILDDPYDASRDFSDKTKEILTDEQMKLEKGLRTKIIKRQFDELSSYDSSHELIERSDDEEDLDKLNLEHHVAIWSIANDAKPMRRLTSPFEITSLSFCPHNGRFLVGGTTTGQVVLWDLEEKLTHEEYEMLDKSDFDILGFKHLERVMCWYKRLKPDKRIYITAISNKSTSHIDRVIDITWLPRNLKVTIPSGKFENIGEGEEDSLQFMSTSADGILKFWQVAIPTVATEMRSNRDAFQCAGKFQLPNYLQNPESKYSKLFLNWDPIFLVRFELRDNVSIKRYHVTSISHDKAIYNYEKSLGDVSKVGRNIELHELYRIGSIYTDSLNYQALIGTLDGNILLFTWEKDTIGMGDNEKEGIGTRCIHQYKPIHDGPITSISRHPTMKGIFLSAGGHVFGVWKIDQVEPLKWKRSRNHLVTVVGWTQFTPSSFRVGRSDGCIEMWDLHEEENEAKIVLKVTAGAVYDFTVSNLPIPSPLFGITDSRGLLKFYNIPWKYRVPRSDEMSIFNAKIEAEHVRKVKLAEKAAEHAIGGNINAEENTEDFISEIDLKSEEIAKRKEVVGCKKFKEELYKWYLRKRGRNAAWLDESEKNWFKKEEEYMIKKILQIKQVNMGKLEKAITPLYKKEKFEKEVAVKVLDIFEMADDIFRKAVQELVLTRDYNTKSQVSLELQNMNYGDLKDAMGELELYFGESYKKSEDELENLVSKQKINKEWTFVELCEKNQPIRDLWNDRRRFFNPDKRWARELVQEEIEKSGYKCSYYINHEESYLQKKYKKRMENIEELKKKFGKDYDPFWDLHDRYANRKPELTGQTSGKTEDFQTLDDILNYQVQKSAQKYPKREVNIVLPKGSFYRKYMPEEKNMKWEKPMAYEEQVFTRSKKLQDKLGESEITISSETAVTSSTGSEGEEPNYTEENWDVKRSEFRKNLSSFQKQERSESTSSTYDSDEPDDGESKGDLEDRSKGNVRFEDPLIGSSETQIIKEKVKKKKVIDYEKEDITGRYRGIEDLRRLVKEKKMRGEEFIDIDDLSGSYESVTGTISSSAPSPDMSLKSDELYHPDEWFFDDSDDEEGYKEMFKNYIEEAPRHETPKVVSYDSSMYLEEPTEEWVEEDLKAAYKPAEESDIKEEKEEEEEDEEGGKKPDVGTTLIMEKEKAVRDKIEKLESLGEPPDVVNIPPPSEQSGAKTERKKCRDDFDLLEK